MCFLQHENIQLKFPEVLTKKNILLCKIFKNLDFCFRFLLFIFMFNLEGETENKCLNTPEAAKV